MSMPSSAVTNATNTNITVNLVDSDGKLYLVDDYPIEQVSHHYWLENSIEIATLYVNNEEIIRTTSDPLAPEYGNTILGSSNPYDVHDLFANRLNQISSGSGSGSNSVSSFTSTSHSSGGFRSDATITRSADTNPYFANDVYGSTFKLTNIGTANGFVILTNIGINFNIATLPVGMGGFTLYLYSSAPSTIPDNAAFSILTTDLPKLLTPEGVYLGTAKLAIGGGLVVLDAPQINRQIPLIEPSVFGRLVTLQGFTPDNNSETATISSLFLGV